MKVFNTGERPIKCWADDIDEGTYDQAALLSVLPFLHSHVALMPDAHLGFGMPIGGVIALENAIIPGAVGVDIGCGVISMKFDTKSIPKVLLRKIVAEISEKIPTGFNKHKVQSTNLLFARYPEIDPIPKFIEDSRYQLGTLGGGNHFIEIQQADDEYIWITIHSGSRNFGLQIANYYIKIAQIAMKKWYSVVPEQLAFLPFDSQIGQDYFKAMQFAMEWADENRMTMMQACAEVMESYGFARKEYLKTTHNYASVEHHFGKAVIVHRKGAVHAPSGEYVVIPGSQGTKSYIAIGLGNPESFKSCSHGAGRKMSRNEAQKTLSLDDEVKAMDEKGIIHGIKSVKDLDEAPSAYKDIDVVMESQKDLVTISTELKPIAVIKG